MARIGVKLSPSVRAPCSTDNATATDSDGSNVGYARDKASVIATVFALGTAVRLQTSIAVLVVVVVIELTCAEVLEGWGVDNPSTDRVTGSAEGGGIVPMAIRAAKEGEEPCSVTTKNKLCPTPNAGSRS